MTTDPRAAAARATEPTSRPWILHRDQRDEARSIVGEVEGHQDTILSAPHIHFLGDVERQRRWRELGEANMALAVRAVNAFDDLVAALEAVEYTDYHAGRSNDGEWVCWHAVPLEVIEQVRAALRQTRGLKLAEATAPP